ncbi:hypothetical protein LCGC14_0513740 [marine sediment metagenome]|uniref:Uncharacterized protein n=1 Tax=marine sediment metagenome TaxID=412755 RepID=A0A0F9SIV2_9ZZZZ
MKVYRVVNLSENEVGAPLILESLAELEDIIGTIDNYDTGDTFGIRVIDVTKKQYENLQEWGGW